MNSEAKKSSSVYLKSQANTRGTCGTCGTFTIVLDLAAVFKRILLPLVGLACCRYDKLYFGSFHRRSTLTSSWSFYSSELT